MGANREGKLSLMAVDRQAMHGQAWMNLRMREMVVYIHLKRNFNGFNRDQIILPYSAMKGIMASDTFFKAIDGLISKGWIRKSQQGGKFGTPSMYELTGTHERIIEGKPKKKKC